MQPIVQIHLAIDARNKNTQNPVMTFAKVKNTTKRLPTNNDALIENFDKALSNTMHNKWLKCLFYEYNLNNLLSKHVSRFAIEILALRNFIDIANRPRFVESHLGQLQELLRRVVLFMQHDLVATAKRLNEMDTIVDEFIEELKLNTTLYFPFDVQLIYARQGHRKTLHGKLVKDWKMFRSKVVAAILIVLRDPKNCQTTII